jgi:hypothetical protein
MSLDCRIQGAAYRLEKLSNGDGYRYYDGVVTLRMTLDGAVSLDPKSPTPGEPRIVDVGRIHAIATLLRGISDPTRVHAVNTPLLTKQVGQASPDTTQLSG